MNDLTNDQPVDDNALFSAITSGVDLPEPEATTTEQPAATAAPAVTTEQQPAITEQARTETIPPGRLREEADARRTAERERDDARAELARLRANPQQPQPRTEPAAPKEIWDDPRAFVQEAVSPIEQAMRRQGEGFSRMFAEQQHTREVVDAAFTAMKEALPRDASAQAEYRRIMATQHPYGELVGWYKNRQVLTEVGNDPAAYRNRILDEALKDPAFLGRAVEAARTGAQPTTEAPGRSGAVSIPSIRNIGTAAVATPSNAGERSDAELFSDITRRKK